MESFMEKEKKGLKSSKHFEIYLEYVKMYSVLKLKWTVQRQYALQIAKIWQDMTRKLNNCGGPVRDVTHWKKVFTEWKSHTRRKLKFNKPLNELEDQLVQLTELTSKPERRNQIKMQRYMNTFLTKESKQDLAANTTMTPEIKQEMEIAEHGTESRFIQKDNVLQLSNKLKQSINLEQEKLSRVDGSTANGTLHTEALPKDRSRNISTQVDEEMVEISNISHRTSIGTGLQSLANALNRYCEIVEKRFG